MQVGRSQGRREMGELLGEAEEVDEAPTAVIFVDLQRMNYFKASTHFTSSSLSLCLIHGHEVERRRGVIAGSGFQLRDIQPHEEY